MSRTIDITVEVHNITKRAYLVSDDGNKDNAQWIPKSEVESEEEPEIGDTVIFDMPEWLAEVKGFI